MRFSRYSGGRRRSGGYGGYGGRRTWPKVLLGLVLAAVVVVLLIGAGREVLRGRQAIHENEALEAQVSELTEQLAAVEKLVPKAMLDEAAKGVTLEYQTRYPEMLVEPTPVFGEDDPKAVYLTFDNGPSEITLQVLDSLKAAGQHATFFVVGKNIAGNEAILKRIADEGHTIGVHSFTQDYGTVYASVDAYLDDFHQTYEAIHEACGVYPTVFRFPGGSVNAYNRNVYQQIIAEMLRRGFVYYDWSASGEDATSKTSTAQIIRAAVASVQKTAHPIVLLHDSGDKQKTSDALPAILEQLASAGYHCDALTNSVKPVTFGYRT